jgi:hypothetical protein
MAKRYSGNLTINVVYDDKNFYKTSVSEGGKLLWRGTVNPAPSGFGPGVAYDSPKAYDEIAQTAIAFAEDEIGGVADEAEFDEDMTGYLVRRSPRAKRAHATKKAPRGNRGLVEYHLEEIDAWRRGDRATPGLSAHGERYAGRMLDAIKAHELALIALGHRPTTEYVRAHGFADGKRGRL